MRLDQTTIANGTQDEHTAVPYSVVVYPDTAEYTFRWLEGWRFEKLYQYQAAHGRKAIRWRPRSPNARYSWRVHLKQPCRDALLLLTECPPEQMSTVRCDLAFDFPLEAAWVASQIRQKWRGNRKCRDISGTIYWAHKITSRNVVPYADRLSKVTGDPTFHLELRFLWKRALESASLLSIEDQLNYPDPLGLLKKQLKLQVLDERKFMRHIAKVSSTKRFLSNQKRIVHHIERKAQSVDNTPDFQTDRVAEIPTQHLYDFYSVSRKSLIDTYKWDEIINGVTYMVQ